MSNLSFFTRKLCVYSVFLLKNIGALMIVEIAEIHPDQKIPLSPKNYLV